jgi:hypothetical protein
MSFERLAFSRFKYLIVVCALAFSAFCAVKASGQCQYDLNGVGYNSGPGDPAACPYRGAARGNYVSPQQRRLMQQQAAVAAANARWSAALKLEADEEAKNSAEAAKAAEDAAAAKADYDAKRDELASMMRGDNGSAEMRGDDAGQTNTGSELRGDDPPVPRNGKAMQQLLGSALGDGKTGGDDGSNAACIADGRPNCLKPVIRVVVEKGEPPIGRREAAFLAHFPESVQKDPKYKDWFDQYKSQAKITNDAHDKMVRDKLASDAAPKDEGKSFQVMTDKGKLAADQKDLDATHDTIVSFHIPGVTMPASTKRATQSAAVPKGNANSSP